MGKSPLIILVNCRIVKFAYLMIIEGKWEPTTYVWKKIIASLIRPWLGNSLYP